MNFYAATLGQLIITEAFVFFIWLRVLIAALKSRDNSVYGRKLLLTSIGLVVTAIAMFGISASRSVEYFFGVRIVVAVTGFYSALVVGSFLFILSAAIENSYKIVLAFFVATGLWTGLYLFMVWA